MFDESKGMFSELMEHSTREEPQTPPPPKASPEPPKERGNARSDAALPELLEDLSQSGYNAHSYRFSTAEIRWLRRFCLKASEAIDAHVSHNTMVRLLFRLADEEWKKNPRDNRLTKLLNQLED